MDDRTPAAVARAAVNFLAALETSSLKIEVRGSMDDVVALAKRRRELVDALKEAGIAMPLSLHEG